MKTTTQTAAFSRKLTRSEATLLGAAEQLGSKEGVTVAELEIIGRAEQLRLSLLAPVPAAAISASDRQRAAARKAWATRRAAATPAAKAAASRRYAEMVARQDGIEEAIEAFARGLN